MIVLCVLGIALCLMLQCMLMNFQKTGSYGIGGVVQKWTLQKKLFLKISQYSLQNTYVRVSFVNKVAAL